MLTKRQINAITTIQRHQLRSGCELKRFKVQQIGRKALVYCEIGIANDEGTAAFWCRTRGIFVVGTRGGIEAVSPSKRRASMARKYPLIYGWT